MCSKWANVSFEENNFHNDRHFFFALSQRFPEYACTFKHTVNYEVVKQDQWDYITEGNQWMYDRYGSDLPWRSPSLASSFKHHGIFESDTRDGLFFDESLANAIIQQFPVRPNTVADAGCGPGYYCAHFTKHANWDVQGYEGNPKAKGFGMWDRIQQLDLAIFDPALPTYELVLSLEVGEHIPKEFESNFLDNVTLMTGKTIILSWAVKGQGGTGHFNEQNNPYVISQMESRGFRYDPDMSARLREASSLEWFKNTIMVFDRIVYEHPTAENYFSLAAAYYNSSQFANSIAASRKALDMRPDFIGAYTNICAAYNKLGQFEEGRKAGEDAVRLDPNNERAKSNLEWSLRELNKK